MEKTLTFENLETGEIKTVLISYSTADGARIDNENFPDSWEWDDETDIMDAIIDLEIYVEDNLSPTWAKIR
jgi:hypothetical protein